MSRVNHHLLAIGAACLAFAAMPDSASAQSFNQTYKSYVSINTSGWASYALDTRSGTTRRMLNGVTAQAILLPSSPPPPLAPGLAGRYDMKVIEDRTDIERFLVLLDTYTGEAWYVYPHPSFPWNIWQRLQFPITNYGVAGAWSISSAPATAGPKMVIADSVTGNTYRNLISFPPFIFVRY